MEDGETDQNRDDDGETSSPAVTVALAALAVVLLEMVVGVVLLFLRR